METGESTEQHSEVLNNNTKTTAAPSNVKSRPKKRVGGVSLNPSKRYVLSRMIFISSILIELFPQEEKIDPEE